MTSSFDLDLSKYNLGWSDSDVEYTFKPEKGLNQGVVDQISWWKGEPSWMTKLRQRSLNTFERKPMAEWFAVNMPDIDFQDIYYYLRPATDQVSEWDDLPEQMKATYEKLRHPRGRAQVPGRRHRAVRVPAWLDQGVDHGRDAFDQGARRRRRGVRTRRGDQGAGGCQGRRRW